MPNSTSCAVSGAPSDHAQPLAQVEDVAQPVVGDLPALGERRHDRPLRPRLDEPVEELHAELDVRPRDRRLRVGVVRQEARPDAQRRGRRAGARLAAASSSSNARWYVSFASREPQRRVQRERELEERERDLLPLAARLEQRQQRAVVLDRLVERPLLARPVAARVRYAIALSSSSAASQW